METIIEKYEYNKLGNATLLGIPCRKVVERWDGSITSTSFNIDDAYYLDNIDINDKNSTDVIKALSVMCNILNQRRMHVKSLSTPVVKGFLIIDGVTNKESIVESELQQIPITGDWYVDGVKVNNVWKSDDVSVTLVKQTARLDYRKLELVHDCVYSVLNSDLIRQISSILPNLHFINSVVVNIKSGLIYSTEEVPLDSYCVVCSLCKSNLSVCDLIIAKISNDAKITQLQLDFATTYDLSVEWLFTMISKHGKPVLDAIDGTSMIRCGGTNYFDLNFMPGKNTQITTKFRVTAYNGSYSHVFGSQSGVKGADSLSCHIRTNGSKFVVAISNGEKECGTIELNKWYSVQMTHSYCAAPDLGTVSSTTTPTDGTRNMFLFWNNRNGTGSDNKLNGDIKLFYMKNCKDGISRLLIPYVNSDTQEIGMLDIINDIVYNPTSLTGIVYSEEIDA